MHRHADRVRRVHSPTLHLIGHLSWGGALVLAGVAVLAWRNHYIARDELWLFAPAALAWSAFVRLALERSASSVVRAVLRLAVAAWLVIAIEHVGGWTIESTWPVLLIAVGVSVLARALFPRSFPDACVGLREEGTPW